MSLGSPYQLSKRASGEKAKAWHGMLAVLESEREEKREKPDGRETKESGKSHRGKEAREK